MSDSKSEKPKFVPLRMNPARASPNVTNNSINFLLTPCQGDYKRPYFIPMRKEELMSLSKKKDVRKKLGFDRLSSDTKPAVRSAKPKLSLNPSQRKTVSFTRTSKVMPPPKSKYASDLSDISEGVAELDITKTSFGKDAHKSNGHSLSVNKFAVRKSSAPCTITKQDMSTQYDISENLTRYVDTSTQTVSPAVKFDKTECSGEVNFENHIQSFTVHKPVDKNSVLQELNVYENETTQNLEDVNDNISAVNKYDEEDQNSSFLLLEAQYTNNDSPKSKDILEKFDEMKYLMTELNKKFDFVIEHIEDIKKNKENINTGSYQPDVSKTPKTDSKNDLRRRILVLNHATATSHTQSKSTKKQDNSLKMYNDMKHELLLLQTPVVDKSKSRVIFSNKKNTDMSYNVLNQLELLTKTCSDEE